MVGSGNGQHLPRVSPNTYFALGTTPTAQRVRNYEALDFLRKAPDIISKEKIF